MCSIKTMIKIAIGIGVLLIVGYAAVPEMRNTIAIVGPYLLFFFSMPAGDVFHDEEHEYARQAKKAGRR
jgi:hypothetical protein